MRIPSIVLASLLLVPSCWAKDNVKLRQIADEDQADRSGALNGIDWAVVLPRDIERRKAVLEAIRGGGLATSTDYFNAALVFQHGESVDDIELAYSLATVAARIEPIHPKAQWLTAAAWDRLLMRKKRPQWYGTQFTRSPFGKWELYTVDEIAVSDIERERRGVPRLEESKERARKMNEE